MAAMAVRARDLTREFRSARGTVHALSGVNLDLPAGAFVTVRGPSGCGKSTLLNLLGLLDRPSAGVLELDGVRTEGLKPDAIETLRRRTIGFLFQDAGLIERMTVMENVLMPMRYRGVRSGDRKAVARRSLDELGIAHCRSDLVETLSGGERQRVGLARILSIRPKIIICDEPTAALDEANSIMVVDRLIALASEGALVVCASHDPLVLSRSGIQITLDRGRIAGEGPVV